MYPALLVHTIGARSNKFIDLLDTYAPIKKKRVCHRKSPWMNKNILDSMRKRDSFKRIAKKTKLESDWINYKKMQNTVNSMIRRAKEKENFLKNLYCWKYCKT